MTSRYPPPSRRPDHPRHSAEPPQSPYRAPGSGRSPRELREQWHAREQQAPPPSYEPRGRHVDDAPEYPRSRHAGDVPEYPRSRHADDAPEHPRSRHAANGYGTSRSVYDAQASDPRLPDPRYTDAPYRPRRSPTDSQEFRPPREPGHRGPREHAGGLAPEYRGRRRDPRDSQELPRGFPSPPRPPGPAQPPRAPRDPRGSQEFEPPRLDPRSSQEFEPPRRQPDYGATPRDYDPPHASGSYDRDHGRDYEHGHDPGPDYGHDQDRGYDREYDAPREPDPYEQDLQLFGEREGRSGGRKARRGGRDLARKRRRKRVLGVLIVLVLLAGLGAGAWVGWQQLRGIGEVADYAGTGEADVIAQVADGASTSDIGAELARLDVVASGRAFVLAAQDNSKIRSVQPGFYRMKTRMSGASAVTMMLDPASRVGQLEIRGGMQLDDVTLPDGKVVPGILSLISTASTAELNGTSTQVPADQLRQAMETTDPATLGVPDWAVPGVLAAEPRRRLEGLMVPGTYDLRPGSSAVDLLKTVVTASALRLQATALTDPSKDTGFSPYELLIISSLVEKEGIATDFGKVSRVIYNRMANQQRLQFDSTINYPLDRQVVTTTDQARGTPGPYNTYLNTGLTPTPIGSPSEAAIKAAIEPEPGPWVFFVKCQTDGTSCFAETSAEHEANVRDARARGVF